MQVAMFSYQTLKFLSILDEDRSARTVSGVSGVYLMTTASMRSRSVFKGCILVRTF